MRFVLVGDDFPAERTLKLLSEIEGAQIVSIFTTPQPEKTSKLAIMAEKAGIPVFPSGDLKKEAGLERLAQTPFDWLININSTVILPNAVLDLPQAGALNMHPGLLPQYAGLHTHEWAIRNGEDTFGATIHFIETKVDVGDIVAQKSFPIAPTDTGMSLFLKCIKAGTEAMRTVLGQIMAGEELPRKAQDLSQYHLYRHKDALDGRIDWNWPAAQIERFVRAGSYHPFASPTYMATFTLAEQEYQVIKASVDDAPGDDLSGTVFWPNEEEYPRVVCGETTSLRLEQIKWADSGKILEMAELRKIIKPGARLD